MAKTLQPNRVASLQRFLDRLDLMPPFFIYYVAAHNYRNRRKSRRHQTTPHSRTSIKELSKKADIAERTFSRIASRLTWDDVKLKHVEPFCVACGVDLLKIETLYAYIRKTMQSGRPYSHLSKQQMQRFEVLSARHMKRLEDRAVIPPAAALRTPESPAA